MHEYDLEELKREIVEGRSLTIKTNNLVNALSADLKSLAKRQQAAERRALVNSGVTYAVTVLVLLALTKVALDAQVDAVRAEGRGATERLSALEQELSVLRRQDERRDGASRTAEEAYRMVEEDKHAELLEQLPRIATLELSSVERAVFDEAGRRARRELSLTSYLSGVEHARAGRYHEASQALRQCVELEPEGAHSAEARFELARAYRALNQQKNAIFLLIKLTEAASRGDILDEATLLLAECQVDVELYADAKATLRTFLRRFEDSPLKNDARQLLSELELKH